jgi:hypothetical protein
MPQRTFVAVLAACAVIELVAAWSAGPTASCSPLTTTEHFRK